MSANTDLGCGLFRTHHFVLDCNNELSQDERKEMEDHLIGDNCLACQDLHQQVKATLKGQNCPSNLESLVFLKNLCSVMWTLETELPRRFHARHRRKLKHRLTRTEKRVKDLEALVKQLQEQIEVSVSSAIQGALFALLESREKGVLNNGQQ